MKQVASSPTHSVPATQQPARCVGWLIGGALAAMLALGGCTSGPPVLHTQVQAFASTPTAAPSPHWQGARYRFDVLPSQAQLDLQPLHAMTEQALAAHGLVRDEAHARFSVQVTANARQTWVNDGWHAHPFGSAWGWRVGAGHGGYGFWGASHWPPTATHWREIRLTIVDSQTQQTVYETQARSENPSRHHDAVFATMLTSALKDFPNPSSGWESVEQPLQHPSAASPHQPVKGAAPLPTSGLPASK